jgi:outer membrane protein assembly factor BamB
VNLYTARTPAAAVPARGAAVATAAVVALAALTLLGCSPSKEKRAERPMALVPLVNRIPISRAWSTQVGGEAPKLQLGLGVAVSGPRAFVASYKGEVIALDVASGRRLWQRALRVPISGGPGAAAGLVVIGTSKGEVIALSDQDGAPRWRVHINAEILSAPAVDADIVAVRSVDGRLHGLSAADGSERWVVDQQVPRLSLRGTSTPTLAGDLAVCGFDNGRVVAVIRSNGTTAWEAVASQQHGTSELQRLADVDAQVVADRDDLFAIGYQGRIVRITRETGEVVWGRDLSSYRGLAIDADAVYVATADGDVVRLDRRNGSEQWRQKGLERRQLSAPAIYGGRLVVGDMDGVVHWLDAASGNFLARESIGHKRRIRVAPVIAGAQLLVFSESGALTAFRAPAMTAATVAARP